MINLKKTINEKFLHQIKSNLLLILLLILNFHKNVFNWLVHFSFIFQAKEVFLKMFPNEEFLPRAPDPEEIVFDNEGSEPKKGDDFDTEMEKSEESMESQDTPSDAADTIVDESTEKPMEVVENDNAPD